jgi:hypothetical protein
MNEDMPWVNLTQEEVDELRTKKHELTEYGKQKLKELMENQEPYPDAMFEEAERREKENEVLQIAMDAMKKHDKAFKELARIERAERILERYNNFYNTECSGLTWGTPITPEFQQAMTLECMLDTLRCENMNHEFDSIPTADINDLIDNLYEQGRESLKHMQERLGPKE